jgi:hypothetical protein
MPDRIFKAETHEPAEQQVVVELLQQQSLRADAVEHLQQRGQQQLLGRHRWPAFCGGELAEGGIQSIKGLIGQLADPPQRMTCRDPILDRDVGEQRAAALLLSSHLSRAVAPFSQGGRVFQHTPKEASKQPLQSAVTVPALSSRPLSCMRADGIEPTAVGINRRWTGSILLLQTTVHSGNIGDDA